MGTVIIGGGDKARGAIHMMETRSLKDTNFNREEAEALLQNFTDDAAALLGVSVDDIPEEEASS